MMQTRVIGSIVTFAPLVGLLLLGVSGGVAFAAEAAEDSGLVEIVVTAEKYSSTIQNTPISISALSGADLAAAGITTVEGAAHEVPGLSMRSAGPGQTEYEARGLASNGGSSPTVGFYLDEVPMSPSAQSQNGKVVIDPDLYDISRIEVLRGPQGTLYGAGSMGGTVKVITNQPKLGTYEGSFEGTLSDTQGGSGNGGGNFMLNLPLGDVFAVRVVGTDTYRSGWLDRVVLNPFPADNGPVRGNVLAAPVQSVTTNVNTESLYGGRVSVLFKPNDDLSVLATGMYQRMVMGGYDEFDSPPGPAYGAHYEAANIPEPIADTVHIFSLTVTENLEFADLTSATAYWDRQEHQTQDGAESESQANGIYPYVPLAFSEVDYSHQFSQELRLTSHGSDQLHWTAGAFFSNLNTTLVDSADSNPVFSSPGNPTGIVGHFDNDYTIRQSALFADGSYKITDTLKFSTGVRWYRYLSRYSQQSFGYDFPSPTPLPPTKTEEANRGFNPRFNFAYSPTADLTTYVSASKGFRPGGANLLVPPPTAPPFCSAGSPSSYGPDSVWSYELGEKAKLFDNWLTINSDFYYIKWKGIQETIPLTCGLEYTANAGDGRSFGPEVEINAKLSNEWSVSASGAYTDAKVSRSSAAFAATVVGSVGSCPSIGNCTIPILNVPKETASVAVTYSTTVFTDYQLRARLADVYVGSSYDEAYSFGIQLPGYAVASARLGISKDNWSVTAFVDNFTDKIALSTANNTFFQFNIPSLIRYSTNQPRTFGTEVNYRF
jgi:iron complex outermembrane recepter protein